MDRRAFMFFDRHTRIPPQGTMQVAMWFLWEVCTTGVLEAENDTQILVRLDVLPANLKKKRVDPTRLELVTSAMRKRLEGFASVRGCSENRLFMPES
jgi:hypothetical protein